MKKLAQKYFVKGILVQASAVLAVFFVGLFMYSLQSGGLQVAAGKMHQLAQLFSSTPVAVDIIPMPYDTPLCTAGVAPANMMIILSKTDAATVYITKLGGNTINPPLNTPFYLTAGSYTMVAQLKAGYMWSARSAFAFSIDKTCDNTGSATTGVDNTVTNVMASSSDSTSSVSTTGATTTIVSNVVNDITTATTSLVNTGNTINTTSSTTSQSPAPTPLTPISAVSSAFMLGKNYPVDWSITPALFKDNVRVYSADGKVVLQAEVPGSQVVLLFGKSSGWTADSIYGVSRGLTQVTGTTRWTLPLDTEKFADGDYRAVAAYFTSADGWKMSGNLDFRISNAPSPLPVTTNGNSSSSEQYVPAWTQPPVATATSQSAEDFTPVLRLVVDDRQITAVGHVFDRELLEVRATTLPAQSVQFLALSLDGAFKPAIKELGKGGRDELLSRDGKEVWTYSVDMSQFPTGNYRLFARVHTLNNTVVETAPSSISVQHLNQLGATPNPALDVQSIPPATATRDQILQRVRDPSTCQNRQECEVFCSSSSLTAAKCTDFARVVGASGNDIPNIQNDVTALQFDIRNQFASSLSQISSRAASELVTSTTSTTTAPLASASATGTSELATNWQFPPSVGRPSLVDILPVQVLDNIVSDHSKLAAQLPGDVNTAGDLQSYCGVIEHSDRCSQIITTVAPELAPVIKKQEDIVQRVEQQSSQIIEQRTGARVFVDTDGDGISDYDEINIYHTDPTKRDTFNSGYSDRAVLLSQSSVEGQTAGTTTVDGKILLGGGLAVENPKITGTSQPTLFNVASVAVAETKDLPGGKTEVSKALFKGKALPNSFVKVYLFSDPIVVTVKTDDQGNWSYILDKTLPDGAHTAYVAMVDSGGQILAKSAPLPFIKEAGALTVEAAGPAIGAPVQQGFFAGLSPLALGALLVGVLGLALSVIGAVIGIRHSASQKNDSGLGAV